MPLDYTHQHSSADIMDADNPGTPIDPNGGSGIPQGGPLTAPLQLAHQSVVGPTVDDGWNGTIGFVGAGGKDLLLQASGAGPGNPGGSLFLYGGLGDDGNDDRASMALHGGSGAGSPGLITVVVPTSDPHVANALWSNSGVLTVSAG